MVIKHELGEQTCGCPGGEGGIGSLGLMDANYCSWNGFRMRSCCVALRTMSRYLYHSTTMGGKSMYTCMCNLDPMLYNGKKNKFNQSINQSTKSLSKENITVGGPGSLSRPLADKFNLVFFEVEALAIMGDSQAFALQKRKINYLGLHFKQFQRNTPVRIICNQFYCCNYNFIRYFFGLTYFSKLPNFTYMQISFP